MAMRFAIPRGQLTSPVMSADFFGAVVTIRYYNGAGAEVTPTVEAGLSASASEAGTDFFPVAPISAGRWVFNGTAVRFRLDLTGTGATTAEAEIWRRTELQDVGPGAALFSGERALTVQDYLPANIKKGLQFYMQHALPQLAAAGVYKILFTTGAKKVLIKSREMYGVGQLLSLQLFKLPTVTPATGTPITVQNFNDVNPVASTVTIRGGVTAPANGTSWGDPQRLFGANSAGQRTGSGLGPGGERVLKANSTYLIVISNPDTGVADVDYFLSWYEGAPDLPLR